MSDARIEALDHLVGSPGWLLYWEHVKGEWGANGHQYQAQLDAALNLVDNDAADSQARQIRSAQKVIASLMEWPKEELARLRRAEQGNVQDQTRRGGA